MGTTAKLSDNELLTLLAILRLGDGAYGVSLCQELAVMSGRKAALASVYKILEQLEKRGLLLSRMGDPSAERGGRAKRYVQVTSDGLRSIDATRETLNNLWRDVPAFPRRTKKERA